MQPRSTSSREKKNQILSELSKFALLSKAKPALRTHRSGNEETTMRPKIKMETHFRYLVIAEMDSTRKTIPVRHNNRSRKTL